MIYIGSKVRSRPMMNKLLGMLPRLSTGEP